MKTLIALTVLSLAPFAQEPKPAPTAPTAPVADSAAVAPEKLTRPLADGLEMSADYYAVRATLPGPIVVCCHMANSSRGEFKEIAQEFLRYGCAVLAVDLRAGKERNGVVNETAAAFEKKNGKPAGYADAYPDLVAAVAWARELRPDAKVMLLGSSYSASLALVYAGREAAGVDAVLAFSPGEYIEGWKVAAEARNIKVPAYVSCGNASPEEKAKMSPIANAIDKKLRSVFIPPDGIPAPHGAESLVQPDPETRRRVWSGIYKLLRTLAPPAPPSANPEK